MDIGFVYFRQVNASFGQVFYNPLARRNKCIQFEISKPAIESIFEKNGQVITETQCIA